MFRLMMVLFSVIGTTLAGAAVVAVLTMGYDTLQPIVLAALLGVVLALPVSYLVAKNLT